jgi:hypothetical protein|tara:strand:- start:42 stop:413 length:372 start_codon:yes stop_codon:yes gene_type:complete
MSLTKTEKEIIKSKFNEYKKMIYDTGAPREKVVEILQSEFGKNPLSNIYESVSKKKDKFKGGVPGAADAFFRKEIKEADKYLKTVKRKSQEAKYDKDTSDGFKRKGPRGDRTKRYSNSVRIIE